MEFCENRGCLNLDGEAVLGRVPLLTLRHTTDLLLAPVAAREMSASGHYTRGCSLRINDKAVSVESPPQVSALPPTLSFVRPARTYSNGRKSTNRPDSGKVTAKGKGVHREVESEGSRRQTVGPMNKNLVEGWKAGVMLLTKQKPDNYPNCRQ